MRYSFVKGAGQKNIEIEMDEDLELPYYGNEEILQHVWLNLLNNAVKFTPIRGTISVLGEKTSREIRIKIKDTGVGMDEKTQASIFDKYYQNDSINIARGSGIGLSIVKRIVTLCGGSIEVASYVGTGTTFTVHLPFDNNI